MILRVAPDAEPIAGNLISRSVRRAGDHRQFRTHPIFAFFTFCYQDSPEGTRSRASSGVRRRLAAPNYVTFQCVAQSQRCDALLAWRVHLSARPCDKLEKQKRETRT